ncbi:zinc finger protein, putative [Plasmodium vinckei lentum]|uniref:Zinc finger protein, putative n=1 Tax=Plasmodium vinckei lentum TaxID=138297 RepID=A0A6V7SXF0_PLAVN|nr:zinc finger protein, putative [Plasmodium vinckei lentum]
MDDKMGRDLTAPFMEHRELAKELNPRKDWLKRILINNNWSDLKLFIKAGDLKKKIGDSCTNCQRGVKSIYYLSTDKIFCDICEEIYCSYCTKDIDVMKDNQSKYIKLKLCRDCFIYINELKCIIHPNLTIDKHAIELVNNFNEISNRYTITCSNISQLNGLILLCQNNMEFLDNFKPEIDQLRGIIQNDLKFLTVMKKSKTGVNNNFIINKMEKNLSQYLKIIKNKITPVAFDALNSTQELLSKK